MPVMMKSKCVVNHTMSVYCRQYQDYLKSMTDYLLSFFERTQPLQDVDKIFAKVSVPHNQAFFEFKISFIIGFENFVCPLLSDVYAVIIALFLHPSCSAYSHFFELVVCADNCSFYLLYAG